jgi:hypothetical protein
VTGEGSFQNRQARPALLAPGTKTLRRSQSAEGIGAGRTAEGAGDLLLDLDRTQIALRLVVVKGHGEVAQEGEDFVLEGSEPVEQIPDGTLLAPTAPSWGWRLRILGNSVG